jgi:hypothetical protein
MADTATKQNDTPTKTTEAAKPAQAKPASKPRAKTAAKSRSTSRTRTAAKSRTRKPAASASKPETKAAPRTQATTPSGGRQVFGGVIDAQEKTLTALADYQTRAAEASQIPGVSAIAGAQAQLFRGATEAYVSAARSLLK